jgi:hypothetical protein
MKKNIDCKNVDCGQSEKVFFFSKNKNSYINKFRMIKKNIFTHMSAGLDKKTPHN